ncbi:FtsX-like permease family protein [Brevibacillus reuszeri]|uniref:ABC transporter permease n=1 Tax=Brevibacillus reuszeri TaxID=54915 RepID=UPI003D1B83C7
MLQMILRKMLNNRWLVGSLLMGLIVAVGLASSIPAFTTGVQQRMLTKDLEQYQKDSKHFPGGLLVSINLNKLAQDSSTLLQQMESYLQNKVIEPLQVPVYEQATVMRTVPFQAILADQKKERATLPESTPLYMLSDLEKHMTLVDGRLPEATPVDGVYEALVTEKALKDRRMILGSIYELTSDKEATSKMLIKPVGVFKEKEGNDPYWFASTGEYTKGFVINEQLFRKWLLQEQQLVSSIQLYTAFHYQSFRAMDKDRLISTTSDVEVQLLQHGLKKNEFSVQFPASNIVSKYDEQSKQFRMILWSLYVPIFVMLGLYLVMVSGLIVERQRTEIAVLSSRGASRFKVFFIFFMEIVILGLCAPAIGPFVGVLLSKMLGISNGFLQFVDRTGLDVTLNEEVFIYAGWTVVLCVALNLVSVFMATRKNIVSHKQEVARMTGQIIWHRLFLDVLLLLVSWYGWYSYQKTLDFVAGSSENTPVMSVDFLLFFVPVFFALGFGLFCLRVYPWILRLVLWAGGHLFPLSLHTTLVQVGRASRHYQFLMLFVTITVAVGMFSASMARTINQNAEERIRYDTGADIRLRADWNSDKPAVLIHRKPVSGPEGEAVERNEPEAVPTQYEEPDFAVYSQLPGVKHAAKVYVNELAEASIGDRSVRGVSLMGIDPQDFGQVAWWKRAIFPHHFYEYLNLLAQEPQAVIVSRTLADKLNVIEGQTIVVGWKDARPVEAIVYAIVDYWPGWNPVPKKGTYSNGKEERYLVVANLPFVQDKMRMEPYQVWLHMNPEASTEELYEGLSQANIRLSQLDNAGQQLIKVKNSAYYLGLNGALTLGFLLSMLITFIGYIMYWVLTLGARKLQYGVFRAMGMPFGQLVRILAWEQLLTFGIAFAIGMTAGKLANMLFLPALGLYLQADKQVPPFSVVSNPQDEQIIYTFTAITLMIGIGVVGILLSRLQIHQAVKLGED